MSGGHVCRSKCAKHDVPMIATVTDSVYCAVCEHAEAERLREQLHAACERAEVMTQGLVKSSAEKIELKSQLTEAVALLERARIATIETDSDLSAYAAYRPLDKDSACRLSWVFRQLCSDIAAWIISVEAAK